jgi:hypothetical protein
MAIFFFAAFALARAARAAALAIRRRVAILAGRPQCAVSPARHRSRPASSELWPVQRAVRRSTGLPQPRRRAHTPGTAEGGDARAVMRGVRGERRPAADAVRRAGHARRPQVWLGIDVHVVQLA